MPKIIEYPKGNFKSSLDLAEAVSSLGGSCDRESCAHKMGLKMSGAFGTKIGTTAKYELISTDKGKLQITELYKVIKNAYDDVERKKFETEAFLKPEVFNKLYERFKGSELPVDMLSKLLIREYEVEEKQAVRVSKYFIDGLQYLNLLDGNNKLFDNTTSEDVEEDYVEIEEEKDLPTKSNYASPYLPEKPNAQILHIENKNNTLNRVEKETTDFIVHIMGPGIDSQIVIKEEEDLLIVDAMLKKVKKKLQ